MALNHENADDAGDVTLTVKPHAFSGSVLTPKHARELTPSLCLAVATALSEHSLAAAAANAVASSSPNATAATDRLSPSFDHLRIRPSFSSDSALRPGGGGASGGGGLGVQYTVWITEAWRVLGWAEPSAALFWEMATMYHTLHVAGRAAAEAAQRLGTYYGGSGGSAAGGGGSQQGEGGGAGGGGGGGGITPSANVHGSIPPILSCGSTSSLGSESKGAGGSVGQGSPGGPHRPGSPGGAGSGHPSGGVFAEKKSHQRPAPAAAKELPVWLVGTFLLLHCEGTAFLRNVSGEDERRFGTAGVGPEAAAAGGLRPLTGPGGVDFASLLSHPSLSPRTRIHAGLHSDNSHCTAHLLRHLRKFLLLSAVPHNADAVRACIQLADVPQTDLEYADFRSNPNSRGSLLFLSNPQNRPDSEELRERHEEEHGAIGLDVRLTLDDLERLNFILQAPSGGLIDEAPFRIGDYLLSAVTSSPPGSLSAGIPLVDVEAEIRKHLELEMERDVAEDGSGSDDEASDVMANLSINDNDDGVGPPGRTRFATEKDAGVGAKGKQQDKRQKDGQGGYHKELSYTNLRGTTILLKPACHPDNQQPPSSAGSQASSSDCGGTSNKDNTNNGRLHDLHISDCSDAHMYLLQPFEHATVAACTGCTIVVGAVAGLLHVVDCERTTITSAARRVLVSNCFDVLQCIFTPSPPLLVGDNRSCQFAPYNTYYEGLREDLLATGLAAAVVPSDAHSPYHSSSSGGGSAAGRDTDGPALQCASNKWKQPVELAKLEIPQINTAASTSVPTAPSSPGGTLGAPGADDKAVPSGGNKPGDDTLQTPILLPSSEFHVLFVPVETEAARMRRVQQEAAERAAAEQAALDELQGGNDGTIVAGPNPAAPPESQYCRNLADVLQQSPFRLPVEYERRALVKADRIRSLQVAMQTDLTSDQKLELEEELNRGFRDWLVTSGNLRQVLDLVHMERQGV